MLWILLACSDPTSGPLPVNNADSFFSSPWPSDKRRTDTGLIMDEWPYRDDYDLLMPYVDLAETLKGFGTNSPIFIQFDGELDTSLLPLEEDSLQSDNLRLLNIDSTSKNWGKHVPIRWSFNVTETHWQPQNLLAVAPSWGFPLEPQTKYALILANRVAQTHPDMRDMDDESHPDHAHYAPMLETLNHLDIPADDIAIATVFTTQNPIHEMARISQWINESLSKPEISQRVHSVQPIDGGFAYTGEILVPLWQHGVKPYTQNDGAFEFDADGRPILAKWEKTAFTLTVPDGDMPEKGWPVAIYSHGTGGDHNTFARSEHPLIAGAQLAQVGIAGFGIAQPLHGDRNEGGSAEFYSFNFLNPTSARSVFRQGALDQVYLAALLSEHPNEFTRFEDSPVRLNPDNLVFMGHSQGGEVGAMALPFMAPKLKAAVFSGAGGALSITIMHRDSGDFDPEFLIRNNLELDDEEVIDSFHPVVALVQTLAEATDPLNYAPYWFANEPYWTTRPIPTLLTEGLNDGHTPPFSTEAMSIAAHLPVIGNAELNLPGHEMLGLNQGQSMAENNAIGFDGTALTAGLLQFLNSGHFAIFESDEHARRYRDFLAGAINGQPAIQEAP